MPPRYAYWTILIDQTPTAFRARLQEDLLPTVKQLQRTNADVILKWFERGKVWDSPEAARAPGRESGRPPEKRGRDWRPGGTHEDPRNRFNKAPKPRDRREPAAGGTGRPEKWAKHAQPRNRFDRSSKPPDRREPATGGTRRPEKGETAPRPRDRREPDAGGTGRPEKWAKRADPRNRFGKAAKPRDHREPAPGSNSGAPEKWEKRERFATGDRPRHPKPPYRGRR